jgi:hypothetical protein
MIAPKDWQRVLTAGIVGGVTVRALSVPLTGMREPFDAPGLYYPLAMLLCGICAALPAPRHWWLAVIGIFLGERLYAYLLLPETRDWLLFSVLINVLIPTWLPAAAGALGVYTVHRWKTRRGSKS